MKTCALPSQTASEVQSFYMIWHCHENISIHGNDPVFPEYADLRKSWKLVLMWPFVVYDITLSAGIADGGITAGGWFSQWPSKET